MSLSRSLIERQFPNVSHAEIEEHAGIIAQLDEQLEMMFDGMVGQIYMYGAKIVSDPGKPERFFGGPEDVARLFLARGVKLSDETVVPYNGRDPHIKTEIARLADEVKVIFYPSMLQPNALTEHFEIQKAVVLRFFEEHAEPFPAGKFFSALIAQKYGENILPLRPMDMYGKPAPDYLAIMHRRAFDQLKKVLGPILEVIDSGAMMEPGRTAETQPTGSKTTDEPKPNP